MTSRPRWILRLALLGLPLLLLIPLSIGKWKADHPPLSSADRMLRAELRTAPYARLSGIGAMWTQLTGIKTRSEIHVADKALLRELEESLRATDLAAAHRIVPLSNFIRLRFSSTDPHTGHVKEQYFFYFREGQTAYVQHMDFEKDNFDGEVVRLVQPRFIGRFEALVSRLAQGAQEKGQHPALSMIPYSR